MERKGAPSAARDTAWSGLSWEALQARCTGVLERKAVGGLLLQLFTGGQSRVGGLELLPEASLSF